MAIIRPDRLTVAQQEEIVTRCNEAYDRGGADALQLVIDAVIQIASDNPELEIYASFTLHVVEAVRQKLSEAVTCEVHDQVPEKSLIV